MAATPAAARPVRDVMTVPVVTCLPTDAVAAAAESMVEAHVGSVIVVDDDRVTGILTERDLLRLAGAGVDPATVVVADWMTPEPDTARPDDDVETIFRSLVTRAYRHLPVVDEQHRPQGVVSVRDLFRLAQIQPAERLAHEVPPGLEGVEVAETGIGHVRGKEGFYHYREYDAVELARECDLEEVWHLLFRGGLPTEAQRAAFEAEVRPLRHLPAEVHELLPRLARLGDGTSPLEALRTAFAAVVQSGDFGPSLDVDAEALYRQALRSVAVFPTLVAALHRARHGEEVLAPRDDLDHAANYLYMLTGTAPPAEHARAVEQYLVLTIDHGFNASTFTSRVITSTGADLGSAVLGGLGALSGPLHGGAPSRALDMVEEIGSVDRADAWLRDAVTSGRRLMGFGHRVYKTDDPRSVMLRDVAQRLDGDRVELAMSIERTAVEILEELKPGRSLYPNVEFYAGIVLDMVGMPRELFTSTFAVSRVIGWSAHVLEQAADNRLIRPSARYVGTPPPQPVPPRAAR